MKTPIRQVKNNHSPACKAKTLDSMCTLRTSDEHETYIFQTLRTIEKH